MAFQPDFPNAITWRLQLKSSPELVYAMIGTQHGRERFWARSAPEEHGELLLTFQSGELIRCKIIESVPARRFVFSYFGGSIVTLTFSPAEGGGTELTVREDNPAEPLQNLPGWGSWLLVLKAAVDFGIDLRNHSALRSWEAGYVDVG